MAVTYQQDSLPSHPADWHQSTSIHPIVVGAEDAATDAEVRYFDGVLVSDETVPSRQVTMHHVQCFQILHPGCYLSRHVDQATVAVEQTVATWITRLNNECKVPYTYTQCRL